MNSAKLGEECPIVGCGYRVEREDVTGLSVICANPRNPHYVVNTDPARRQAIPCGTLMLERGRAHE